MSMPPPPAYPPAPYGGYGGYGAPPPQPRRLRGRIPRLLGWIFLGLAVAAFAAGAGVIATKSLGEVGGFHRVTFAAASGTVQLDGSGKWVGYYEAHDVSDATDRLPAFRVAVLDPSGTPVTLQTYGNRSDGKVDKFTYSIGNHHGIAAFQFDASGAGGYQVQIQAEETLPSDADVAIGRDIAGGTIAGGVLIVVGVLFLVAAIVLIVIGYVKRGRHRRELQAAAAYYAAPPPGYGPPPSYPPSGYPPPSGYGPPQTYEPPSYGPPPS